MSAYTQISGNPFGCVFPRHGAACDNDVMRTMLSVQAGTYGLFRMDWRTELSDFVVEFPASLESRSKSAREQNFGFKSAGHALRVVDGLLQYAEDI